MEVWTDCLEPEVYRLADGRTLPISSADVRNAAAQGNAMLRAGLRIPGCWEHDLSAFPEYASNPRWYVAKHYYGDVKQYRLDGHKLQALMSFADEKDYNQFKKVGTVSPRVVFNRIDERGIKWPGLTIAHVASTPTPIQRTQARVPYDFSSGAAAVAPRNGHYDLSTSAGSMNEKVITMLQGIIAMLSGDATPKDETPADDEFGDEETEVNGGAGDEDEVGAATNATSPMVMSALPAAAKIQATGAIESHRKRMMKEAVAFFRAGRLTRQEAKEHADRVKAADLSLTNGWELRLTPVVIEHNTFAKLSPRKAWAGKATNEGLGDLAAFAAVDAPAELKGPADQDKPGENRALKFALERANRTGGK